MPVTGTQKAPTSNTRIEKYGFIADIIVSPSSIGEIFHYIIQRADSPEVMQWGQEVSMEDAVECIDEFMKRHEKKQA